MKHETDTHAPGSFRPRGIRNKGRGRGVSAASRAGHAQDDAWIVRYNQHLRNAARLKLRGLDSQAPQALRELLERAAFERFEPYRRERKFRAPERTAGT